MKATHEIPLSGQGDSFGEHQRPSRPLVTYLARSTSYLPKSQYKLVCGLGVMVAAVSVSATRCGGP